MKISFWDRILIYLFAALTVLMTVLLALRAFSLDAVGALLENLQSAAPGIWWRLIVIGLAVIEVLLGVFTIGAVTPVRRKRELFVTLNPGKEDGAQVRIAVSAIREMVRQAVSGIGGLNGRDPDVTLVKNELAIGLTLDVDDRQGNVPALTSLLQQSIRQKVMETCGVNVKTVMVTVNSIAAEPMPLTSAAEAPAVDGLSETEPETVDSLEETPEAPAPEEAQVIETEEENTAEQENEGY